VRPESGNATANPALTSNKAINYQWGLMFVIKYRHQVDHGA
jgi:hypothetical protein